MELYSNEATGWKIIGTVVALQKFPINKKSFEALQNALERKCGGMDYSEYEDIVEKMI